MLKEPQRLQVFTALARARKGWMMGAMLMASLSPGRADEVPPTSALSPESPQKAGQKMEAKMQPRQALMQERRRGSEKLREILQSNTSSPEDKRKAMEEFRAKNEALRSAMPRKIPESTGEEKAASRQKMKEWISRLPEERRTAMESQLAVSEEMEKLRSEEKNLTPEERRARMQALVERRREAMRVQQAAIESEAAREPGNLAKRPRNSFREAMESERQKLDVALATNEPEKRRAAMESFRAAMNEMREARLRETERRPNSAMPPSPEGQMRQPSLLEEERKAPENKL